MRNHRAITMVIALLTSAGLGVSLGSSAQAVGAPTGPSTAALASGNAVLAGPSVAKVGQRVHVVLTFQDKARATTIAFDWGDGSGTDLVALMQAKPRRKVAANHRYTQPGTYVIAASVGRKVAKHRIVITGPAATDASEPTTSSPTPRQCNVAKAVLPMGCEMNFSGMSGRDGARFGDPDFHSVASATTSNPGVITASAAHLAFDPPQPIVTLTTVGAGSSEVCFTYENVTQTDCRTFVVQ